MAERVEGAETVRPLITIGLVVYNREWIVGRMLDSLLSQDYPHDRIYFVVVDGGSEDSTVDVIKGKLEGSDLFGYEIIVERCNIPEGRNICIDRMKGDVLVFWDSDVVARPDVLSKLVEPIIRGEADVVSADGAAFFINSPEDLGEKLDGKLNEVLSEEMGIVDVPSVGMGCTAIARRVLQRLRFDEDLTYSEDLYFSVMARALNFRVVVNRGARAYDVNWAKKKHSNIYVEMPLKDHLRGLRKKAKAHVLAYDFKVTFRTFIKFFWNNKRYVFCLGYILMAIITLLLFLSGARLFYLPILSYIALYLALQTRKRGFRKAVNSLLRSVVVGIPLSIFLVYYFIKYAIASERLQSPSAVARELEFRG